MYPVPLLNSSLFPSNSIKIIAETLGITYIDDSVCKYISNNITYWLSLILQESKKLARHQKRTFLTIQDFNKAIKVFNFEQLYGFNYEDKTPYKKIVFNNKDIYYTNPSVEADLSNIALSTFPKLCINPHLKAHWFLIEGKQPNIPENVIPDYTPILAPKSRHDTDHFKTKKRKKINSIFVSDDNFDANSSISMEQQLYFKDITEACVGSDESRRSQAFQSLATDPGLHILLPRFSLFISNGVKINLIQRNLAVLIYLMRMVRALLENPHLLHFPNSSISSNICVSMSSSRSYKGAKQTRQNKPIPVIQLRRYAHSLVPAVMSCCFCDAMCQRPEMDNHWALRDFSAKLIAQFCKNMDNSTNSLQNRICRLCYHITSKYLLIPSSQHNNYIPNNMANKLIPSNISDSFDGKQDTGSMPSRSDNNDGTDLLLSMDSGNLDPFPPMMFDKPTTPSLYGALTCLLELGPLVLNLYLPPSRIKDLDNLLTAQRNQLEKPQSNLTILQNTSKSQVNQQQKLMSQKVSIEHVKQLLIKIGAMLYKYKTSNLTTLSTTNPTSQPNLINAPTTTSTIKTEINLEELKEQYGQNLATAIYTHIKKMILQQQQQQLNQQLNQQRLSQLQTSITTQTAGIQIQQNAPLLVNLQQQQQQLYQPHQLLQSQGIRSHGNYQIINSSNLSYIQGQLKQEFKPSISQLLANNQQAATSIRINQLPKNFSNTGQHIIVRPQLLSNASHNLNTNHQQLHLQQTGSSSQQQQQQQHILLQHQINQSNASFYSSSSNTMINNPLGSPATHQRINIINHHNHRQSSSLASHTNNLKSIYNFANNQINVSLNNNNNRTNTTFNSLFNNRLVIGSSGSTLNQFTATLQSPINISSSTTNNSSTPFNPSPHSDYIKQFINESSSTSNKSSNPIKYFTTTTNSDTNNTSPNISSNTPNYIKFMGSIDYGGAGDLNLPFSNSNNNNNHDSDIECIMEIEPSPSSARSNQNDKSADSQSIAAAKINIVH